MGWPRKAVDAPMFAPPIGIERPVKGHIGRLVARDDPPWHLFADLGALGEQRRGREILIVRVQALEQQLVDSSFAHRGGEQRVDGGKHDVQATLRGGGMGKQGEL